MKPAANSVFYEESFSNDFDLRFGERSHNLFFTVLYCGKHDFGRAKFTECFDKIRPNRASTQVWE